MTESRTEEGIFSHSEVLSIMAGLLLGMLLAALDQTVVATAIRTISDDLNGFSLQAWATTAFLITATITTPLYGKLSDIFGRRPLYIIAISLFILGSALCGLAQSMYQLAAFRAFQGIGAGGLFSLAFAIIGDIVPPMDRAKYQGYFTAVFATSSVLGPLVGGVLAGADSLLGVTGWRWIFYVNVPVGLAALFVVFKNLHLPVHRQDHRIDWWGALALIVCLVPLLLVAEQGREWGWLSSKALACYGIGLAGLVGFVFAERALGDEALLPPRMFHIPTFSLGNTATLVIGMGMFGGLALVPIYLQVVRGSSPMVAGFQTLPLVIGIMSGATISGKAISKNGKYKRFPLIGTVLLTVGLLLFSIIHYNTPMPLVMGIMVIFGVGLGFNMPPMILAVQNAVKPQDMGVATASVTFFRQMGGTLGTAIYLSVLFSILPGIISDEVQQARTTPAFQQAVAQNPQQAAALAPGASSELSDTSFLSTLDHRIAQPFEVGFSNAIDNVFLIAAGIMLLSFFLVLAMPELPLRNQSGIQARHEEASGAEVGTVVG